MKRIVIIEGNVSSLSRHHEEYSTSITRGGSEVVLDLTTEAADMIGASFREPVRVVVEIGEGEIPIGGLKDATPTELIHALAQARHAADEYRRENEALVKSNEGLRVDLGTMRAKNNEMHDKIAVGCGSFDPEKHITKATVAKWLEEDARDSEYEAKHTTVERSEAFIACAQDTRAIIARINAHKDSP